MLADRCPQKLRQGEWAPLVFPGYLRLCLLAASISMSLCWCLARCLYAGLSLCYSYTLSGDLSLSHSRFILMLIL